MGKLRVAVIMGGKSPEYEVSITTGNQVIENLDKNKYEIIPVRLSKNLTKKEIIDLINLTPSPDIFFIAMHGPFGEDGTIQGMLDFLGLKYTGAGVLGSALGMNKIAFRKVLQSENLPNPKYFVLTKGEKKTSKLKNLGPPWVVKPSSQGSSVGVSISKNQNQLQKALKKAFQYDEHILIEEYLAGIEISCGVLGNKHPFALPVIEICFENEFFDYEAKYTPGKCKEIVPARIDKTLTNKVQDLAVKVYRTVHCQGFGRIDMIIKNNNPYILEINTIPGLTPTSLLPQEAETAGISFSELLDLVIKFGLNKES